MYQSKREEMECLLTFDKQLNEWHLYSDVPTLNRKWEHVVEPERKEYNRNGQLVLLEGTVTGTVSVSKKRKLTEEQKAALAARLNGTK